MDDPTSDCTGRFRDAHAILILAETPGLPFPYIGASGAAFNFTHITHARETAEAVALAETVLSHGLKTDFSPVIYQAGSTRRYVLEGWLPSGMRVSIVARGEHMEEIGAARKDAPAPAEAEARPEMAEAAA